MNSLLLVKVSGALLLLLTFTGISFAGGSMSIPVSCSIPAVPGLNAPLTDSAGVENPEPKAKISVNNILPRGSNGEAQKTENFTLENVSERLILAKGAAVVEKRTKTIYSR